MRLQFATLVPIGTASLKNNRNPARMRIPAATAVVAASPAVGAISRASESKRSVATGIVLGRCARARRGRRASDSKGEWNVYANHT